MVVFSLSMAYLWTLQAIIAVGIGSLNLLEVTGIPQQQPAQANTAPKPDRPELSKPQNGVPIAWIPGLAKPNELPTEKPKPTSGSSNRLNPPLVLPGGSETNGIQNPPVPPDEPPLPHNGVPIAWIPGMAKPNDLPTNKLKPIDINNRPNPPQVPPGVTGPSQPVPPSQPLEPPLPHNGVPIAWIPGLAKPNELSTKKPKPTDSNKRPVQPVLLQLAQGTDPNDPSKPVATWQLIEPPLPHNGVPIAWIPGLAIPNEIPGKEPAQRSGSGRSFQVSTSTPLPKPKQAGRSMGHGSRSSVASVPHHKSSKPSGRSIAHPKLQRSSHVPQVALVKPARRMASKPSGRSMVSLPLKTTPPSNPGVRRQSGRSVRLKTNTQNKPNEYHHRSSVRRSDAKAIMTNLYDRSRTGPGLASARTHYSVQHMTITDTTTEKSD